MAGSDDDAIAERLMQVRAIRRHLRRLRVAERRDAAHERAADSAARWEADAPVGIDALAAAPVSSADTRTLLIAEQAPLELDRAALAVDGEVDAGIGMEL